MPDGADTLSAKGVGDLDHPVAAHQVVAQKVGDRAPRIERPGAGTAEDPAQRVGLAKKIVVPLLKLLFGHSLRADQDMGQI